MFYIFECELRSDGCDLSIPSDPVLLTPAVRVIGDCSSVTSSPLITLCHCPALSLAAGAQYCPLIGPLASQESNS